MTKIVYFPCVETADDLIDLISRAAWFLSFCSISRITIPIASENLRNTEFSVPSRMDDEILERYSKIREKIAFVYVSSERDIETHFEEAAIILKWKVNAIPDFLSPQKLNSWETGKKVWSVDPHNTRMEGSFYIEVGLYLLEKRDALIRENKLKFNALVKRLGRFRRAYVMATGPSVRKYPLYDYENAISLVCNSVILDHDLMARVRPQILVFADPIFHFGPSQYAAEFRQRLLEAAGIHDFTIVIPFKYYELFVSTIPELRNRTIAVPFVKNRPFNFDIADSFEVSTTANILTLLLLPLATTFSDEIGILGCDGRPVDDNTYFWGHNPKTQINDKMANIREVHPAFFDIDYNDYYLDHCATLESQLSHGEDLGKKFVSLGFSYIPALRSRMGVGHRAYSDPPLLAQTALIVDPDAKSWIGHYMAYNEKLSAQLAQDGLKVEVACSKDLLSEILESRPNYFPVLTSNSWSVDNPRASKTHTEKFEAEISSAVESSLLRCDGTLLVYMYCGSLGHAEVFERLVKKHSRLTVNINLFWLSFRLSPEYVRGWQLFIEKLGENSHGSRFILTVPTSEVRDHFAELSGCILPVAPHPSTGVTDQIFKDMLRKNEISEKGGALNVLFPSAPREEKGYRESVESVRLLCDDSSAFHPIIKHAPTFSTTSQMAQPISEIDGAEVVEGELTNDEFLELFARSDIVVLPYTPDAFAERTSGLLIDAVYFGIPCVVIRGTWLGNFVQKFGCGVLVDELSATSLVEGVKEIFGNYVHFRDRAREAGKAYFLKNSWHAFSAFLRNSVATRRPDDEEETHILVGPYSREVNAHWDETVGIAKLFQDSTLSGTTMIDVGAHHGSALVPFLNLGWIVYAFEPDDENRSKLLERLSTHKKRDHVSLDTRCISNQSQKNVSFFTSKQSTGISGLSAFHESHEVGQTVDITTLTDFFFDKPLSEIDFLKIDTEGHDLFVLQGFPWERSTPKVIECEFEDSKTVPLGYTFHDLAGFLVDKGYSVYVSEWHPIIRYGIRHDWNRLTRYPSELSDRSSWGNLLAFRDSIDEEYLLAAVKSVLKIGGSQASSKTPAFSSQPRHAQHPNTLQDFWNVLPGAHFSSLAPNQWRYTHDGARQKLWIATTDLPEMTIGRTFAGCLRIQSDKQITVNVSIGRHGNSEYEGATQRINLSAGVTQSVKLSKRFTQSHAALKLQVEVIDLLDGDSAVLAIDNLGIGESLTSISDRLGKDTLDFREANRLFRERDYLTAISIYLGLIQRRPLPMYRENVLMAARRAGMSWVMAVEELMFLTE